MPTIVEYTERKPSENRFPARIVSPTSPHSCCHNGMETVGVPLRDGPWVFQYRRCRTCGFTVRAFLRYVPDEISLADLRRSLKECRLSGFPE